MRIEARLTDRLLRTLRLAPGIIEGLEILSAPLPELEARVRRAVRRNPFLVLPPRGVHADPRPSGRGAAREGSRGPTLRADVVVVRARTGRGYRVRVDDGIAGRLRIDRGARLRLGEAAGQHARRASLEKRLDTARGLIHAIAQRHATLLELTQVLVRLQPDFPDHGFSSLRPLKFLQVAEAMGRHIGTIARALNGKTVRTPRGVFPLKAFFAGRRRASARTRTS